MHALCEKQAILGPFPPTANLTAVTTVFPCTGVLRFLLSPKTQMMSQNKLYFTLQMPDCCLKLRLLPSGRSSARWWVVFRGVYGAGYGAGGYGAGGLQGRVPGGVGVAPVPARRPPPLPHHVRAAPSDKAPFHTENARLLSESAAVAQRTYDSPAAGGWFSLWSREG